MNEEVKEFLIEEGFDCKVFALVKSEYANYTVEELKDNISVDEYNPMEITIDGDTYNVYDEYEIETIIEDYVEDVKRVLDRNSHFMYSRFVEAIDIESLELDAYDVLDIESEVMYEDDLYYIEKC